MEIEDLGERFCQVLHQVKAIGALRRLRSPLPRAISRGFRAIASADLDARVGLEPLGSRLRCAVRSQGHRPPALQVNQHRAIRLALAQGEIVDTEHSGGRTRWDNQPAQEAQEHGAATCPAQAMAELGAGRPAEGHGHVRQPVDEALRLPGPRRGNRRQTFGEDLTKALRVLTTPLSHPPLHTDAVVCPGQIGTRACVAAMQALSRHSADRTMRHRLR